MGERINQSMQNVLFWKQWLTLSYVNVYIRQLMSSSTLCQVLQQIIKNVIVNQKDARKTLHNDFT